MSRYLRWECVVQHQNMDTEKEQREMKTKKWTRAVPHDMISAGHKDSAQCELAGKGEVGHTTGTSSLTLPR